MKKMTAILSTTKTKTIAISDCKYIKSMTPLPELLEGEKLLNPIEVYKYDITDNQRGGAAGITLEQKKYRVHRGSQRVQAAIQLGYTHISANIING